MQAGRIVGEAKADALRRSRPANQPPNAASPSARRWVDRDLFGNILDNLLRNIEFTLILRRFDIALCPRPMFLQGSIIRPRPVQIDVSRASARADTTSLKEDYMATGTVKFFNTTKGFGFIGPDDGSKDVFVHISAVEKSGLGTIKEGQKLSYELERGKDGKSSASQLKAV